MPGEEKIVTISCDRNANKKFVLMERSKYSEIGWGAVGEINWASHEVERIEGVMKKEKEKKEKDKSKKRKGKEEVATYCYCNRIEYSVVKNDGVSSSMLA